MYKPYIGYVDKYFPNAVSVVDSFHVVKHINHQIRLYMSALARKIRARDEELHRERELVAHRSITFHPSKEYYIVKNYQWIVLKNQEDLKYSKEPWFDPRLRFYVDVYKLEYMLFEIDPSLKEFRKLKEKYIQRNK